ncbi:MAG: hypothetical protein H5T86_15580, partial [Armatimonadetes bacterium]|nr:hypothetical protein [Armatimonadota bacterium]
MSGALILAAAACLMTAASVEWDAARLELDDQGRVTGLVDVRTGTNLVPAAHPFCTLKTRDGQLAPIALTRDGERIRLDFPGGAAVTFRVAAHKGFSLWQVDSLTGISENQVDAVVWCQLPLTGLKTLGGSINAYYDDQFAVA